MSGGTGVIGRAAVPALIALGHDVVVLTRSEANRDRAIAWGAAAVAADLFDVDSLVRAYEGADAVVNLATHIPVGYSAVRPGAWRRNDALRTHGSGNVVAAARRAEVGRVVQESISLVYADGGDTWITEDDAVAITTVTEPVAVAESHVQDFTRDGGAGVVLRFGTIVGDDGTTRFLLRAAGHGRPVGWGRPAGWVHPIHTDDLGSAVAAALAAPAGVYNVGAEPVLRQDLVAAYAARAGVDEAAFAGPLLRRLAGPRLEPLMRSLRVSSELFSSQTGWRPVRPVFSAAWFDAEPRLEGAL